jgi:hypothetical protein
VRVCVCVCVRVCVCVVGYVCVCVCRVQHLPRLSLSAPLIFTFVPTTPSVTTGNTSSRVAGLTSGSGSHSSSSIFSSCSEEALVVEAVTVGGWGQSQRGENSCLRWKGVCEPI